MTPPVSVTVPSPTGSVGPVAKKVTGNPVITVSGATGGIVSRLGGAVGGSLGG